MADDKKHANDEYVNPGAVTSAAPPPPEIFPDELDEQKQDAKDNAEKATPAQGQRSERRAAAAGGKS